MAQCMDPYQGDCCCIDAWMIDVREGCIRAFLKDRASLLPSANSSPNGHRGRKSYIKSSGSSAGGGGSNLPTQKCSMPVQATITPLSVQRLGGGHTSSRLLFLTTRSSRALTYLFDATPPETTRCFIEGSILNAHSIARSHLSSRCNTATRYFWIQLPVSLESSDQHMRSCNLYVVSSGLRI